MFTKQYFKRLSIIILMIFIAFVGIVLILDKYYRYSQEKAQRQFVEEMQRPYFEDTYGGKTPEETFDMFLDALKKGDTELASKYYDIKKQKEERENLEKSKANGNLEKLVDYLSNGLIYKGDLYEGDKQYEIRDKNGEILWSLVDFIQYPSGIWKITEL